MPPVGISKYIQSKRSTQRLAEWLARSASEYGFPLSNFQPSTQPRANDDDDDAGRTAEQLSKARKNKEKKARQKAKKREEAGGGAAEDEGGEEQGGQSRADAVPPPPQSSYTLKIPQFVEIAKFLVEKGASIPLHVMDMVETAVETRLHTTGRFFSAPDASTLSHLHFIRQLEDVRTLFRAYRQRHSAPAAAKEQPETKASLSNRFASLGTEEAEDEGEEDLPDIELPPPSRPAGKAASTTHLTFELEDTRETALEKLSLFYEDVHAIRKYCSELWSDYRDGKIDLLAASVTANTALELLRRPHDDVVATVLPFFNYNLHEATAQLCFLLLKQGGMEPLPCPLPLFSALDGYPQVGLADMLKGLKDGYTPFYKPSHFGAFDPTLDFKKADYATRWKHGQVLVCESLAEYLTFIHGFEPMFMGGSADLKVQDKAKSRSLNPLLVEEIASEMHTFARTRRLTLLLMCQSQYFIDMNFALGTSAKRGFAELKAGASRMLASLEERNRVEGSARPPSWLSTNDAHVAGFMKEISIWTADEDPVTTVVNYPARQGGLPIRQSSLMQRNTTLCGVLLFRIQIAYQNIGLVTANSWSSILFTAHLVIACRHSGAPEYVAPGPAWPDMDKILEMHRAEDVFGGPTPNDVQDSLQAFWSRTGVAPAVLEAMARMGSGAEIPAGLLARAQAAAPKAKAPTMLKDHTQILGIFRNKYLGEASKTRMEASLVEALAARLEGRDKGEPPTGQAAATSGMSKAQKRNLRRKQRSHSSSKWSIPQLLDVLEHGLRMETDSIRFDYISMHVRCLRALRAVKNASHAYLASKQGPSFIREDHELPTLVGNILYVAVQSRLQAQAAGYRLAPGQKFASKLLAGATSTLDTFLRSSPNEASKELVKLRLTAVAE